MFANFNDISRDFVYYFTVRIYVTFDFVLGGRVRSWGEQICYDTFTATAGKALCSSKGFIYTYHERYITYQQNPIDLLPKGIFYVAESRRWNIVIRVRPSLSFVFNISSELLHKIIGVDLDSYSVKIVQFQYKLLIMAYIISPLRLSDVPWR